MGYLTGDLAEGEALAVRLFGATVVRRFELPQFALAGIFLAWGGEPDLEVFTFTNPRRLEQRRPAAPLQLDHVAFCVQDIDAAMREMTAAGVRFAGADLQDPATGPFELGAARHVWTLPESAGGLTLQLIQR